MKRVMCVYLPRWPLQRLWHARPELRAKPVAIAAARSGEQSRTRGTASAARFAASARAKVLVCCDRAARAGVRPGMPVAEARATCRHLTVCDEDPANDLRALKKLAAWAERYSPTVGLEEGPAPLCLLLDVTGCAACFHGEDRLAYRAEREFGEQGWLVRVAITDTVGAAWAFSQWPVGSEQSPVSSQWSVVSSQAAGPPLTAHCPLPTAHWIRPLPVAALRLPDEALQALSGVGIVRIEQLLDLPRDSVPGRFGALVLLRLDQLLGRQPELIVPCRLQQAVQARCSFEYATDRRSLLQHALDRLLERIVAILEKNQRGAKHVECWFYHETAKPERIDVRLFRPSRSAAHLGKLLRTRLEQVR